MKSSINSFLDPVRNKRNKTELDFVFDNILLKWILGTFFFILFSTALFAQPQVKTTLSGTVIEKDSQQPLEFVNVSLFRASDSTLVKGAVTNKTGEFMISEISAGKYYIKLNSVGYQPDYVQVSVTENTSLKLGTIILQPANIMLNDVSVVRQQTTMSNSIDRKTYHVENDILGQTGSASDILENIPSVTVDVDGTVSLRGSSNVTFFINGRPSALLKHNSAMALQQIPASTIERIEVITNPSAKYKPDGTGGIINIVLKKDKKRGFNGSLMGNAGNQGRYNANLTLNYNTGKMNIYGNYGFRRSNYPSTFRDTRINRDSLQNIINYYENSGSTEGSPVSHLGNMGLDYQFNEHNRLEVSGNADFQHLKRTQNTFSIWKNAAMEITSEYHTFRLNEESEMEWESSAVFTHQFDQEDHELQIELNVTGYDETEDNHYTETYSVPAGREDISRNLIKKGGPQTELYVEYVLPIGEESELDAGYVGEFFNDNLTHIGENFDQANNKWITDTNKTNNFIFHQYIHALYTTFAHSFEKLSFMAGLRAEQALITSNLLTLDSIVPNNYFRLYPTLHLAYEFNDEQQIQLNYSHRVRRPDSDEMNPFPEYIDPRNAEAGNPRIKPEQIHSIEFGYQLKKEKFTFQPTVYYRYKYDAFAEIQKYVNDSVLVTSFENLTQDQSVGMELIATLNAGKFLTINLSSNGYYHIIDASNLGYSSNKSAFSVDTKLGANLNISRTTLLQMYAYHRSARLTAQGRRNPVFYSNFGIRQDILKEKASLILTVSDVFNTLKSESLIDTPQLYKKSVRSRVTQIIYFGFVYRFGNSSKQQGDLKFDDSI